MGQAQTTEYAMLLLLVALLQGLTNVVIIQRWFKKLAAVDEGRSGVRLLLAAVQLLRLPRSYQRGRSHGRAKLHPVLLARLDDRCIMNQ